MRKQRVQAAILVCAIALSTNVFATDSSGGTSKFVKSWWNELGATVVEWWGVVLGSGGQSREVGPAKAVESGSEEPSYSTQNGGPGACDPLVMEESCSIDPNG